MKLPLRLEGHTIRDAENRVIVSALNPCDDEERRQIVEAVNATMRRADARKDVCWRTNAQKAIHDWNESQQHKESNRND